MTLFKFEFFNKTTGIHAQTVHVRRDTKDEAEREAMRIVQMYRHKLHNLSVEVTTPEL